MLLVDTMSRVDQIEIPMSLYTGTIVCSTKYYSYHKLSCVYYLVSKSKSNFNKKSQADVQLLPYDYYSIMHYHDTAFSVSWNLKTITPVDPSMDSNRLGSARVLTELDIMHTNIQFCPGEF